MAKLTLNFKGPPQSSPRKIQKQEHPAPLSPGDITSPISHATVHALVAALSPIKPSRFFDGELTNGLLGLIRSRENCYILFVRRVNQ